MTHVASTAAVMPPLPGAPRHDWTPRGDPGAVRAAVSGADVPRPTVHRQHFDPSEVQISTLLSIKTGGCPEDCAYCPQSAQYDTGVKAEKLMEPRHRAGGGARRQGGRRRRFCMGAAWRSPKDRDLDQVCAMVEGVKALGLETCVTLGMLTGPQASRLQATPASTTTTTTSTPRRNITARSSPRAPIRTGSTRWRMCATPASMSAAAASSAWARAPRTASA